MSTTEILSNFVQGLRSAAVTSWVTSFWKTWHCDTKVKEYYFGRFGIEDLVYSLTRHPTSSGNRGLRLSSFLQPVEHLQSRWYAVGNHAGF